MNYNVQYNILRSGDRKPVRIEFLNSTERGGEDIARAGKIVLFGNRSAESGKLNIALDNVNNGLYIIQVKAKDGTTYPAKKFIVLK